jgi:hypothetical protein
MEKNPVKGFLTFLMCVIFLAFSLGSYAQTTVSGNVTGEDGAAIPGVSIVVQGTTQGTISDIDGNYTLALPDGAEILEFSYIGMLTQEVEIAGKTTINVVMKADVI